MQKRQRWGAANEALLTCPPLASCCGAGFLTGCGPYWSAALTGLQPWGWGPLLRVICDVSEILSLKNYFKNVHLFQGFLSREYHNEDILGLG